MPLLTSQQGLPQKSQVSGFWSGSFVYRPFWSPSPLTVSIGTGPDSNGITWLWDNIDGWDSPDVAGEMVQRTADHGAWPSSQYYAPRVMTITVEALCPDQPTRDLARALLQQVIPVNDLCTLTYNEPIHKFAKVRRSGQIKEVCPNLTDVIFSIVVTAPDPRKYSQSPEFPRVTPLAGLVGQAYLTIGSKAGSTFTTLGAGGAVFPNNVTPGSITVTNFGTFETRPTITVFGPLLDPGLRNRLTGQSVTWTGLQLNNGDRLVVDFDSRFATLNGAYFPADLSSSWWTLWPGQNVIELLRRSSDAGGGFMTVAYNDAWI